MSPLHFSTSFDWGGASPPHEHVPTRRSRATSPGSQNRLPDWGKLHSWDQELTRQFVFPVPARLIGKVQKLGIHFSPYLGSSINSRAKHHGVYGVKKSQQLVNWESDFPLDHYYSSLNTQSRINGCPYFVRFQGPESRAGHLLQPHGILFYPPNRTSTSSKTSHPAFE